MEAERLLGRVETSAPAWAAGAKIDLRVRQVRLLLGLDKKSAALLGFRELALAAGPSRVAAFRLVRDYVAEGESARALLLAGEAVRLLPDEPAVDKLMKEVRVGLPPAEI